MGDDAVLILSRRNGESILIGDDIEVAVVGLSSGQVRIGIRAPKGISVDRRELRQRKLDEGVQGSSGPVCPAGEIKQLRPGIDYDPDAVCPGCRCFRDKCACDLRDSDPNSGLREPSTFPPMPSVKAAGGVRNAFAKLAAGENPEIPTEKN